MPKPRFEQIQFHFDSRVASLGVNGAFLAIGGVSNQERHPEFDLLFAETINGLRSSLTDDAIASDPILKGYRFLHDAVKRSNQRFVSAPENLLRLLLQRGTTPRINLLVDIYNLVSLQTRLAFGAHDLAHVDGNIEFRLTRGTEPFHALGIDKPTTVGPGEYAYIDSAGDVLCRLEVRQAEKSKVTLTTTEAFYIIQGNPAVPAAALQAAVDELVRLTTTFCGGTARILRITN